MIDMAGGTFGTAQRLADSRGGARRSATREEVTRAAQMVNRRAYRVAVGQLGGFDGAHGRFLHSGGHDEGGGLIGSSRISIVPRPMMAENCRPSGTNHWAR